MKCEPGLLMTTPLPPDQLVFDLGHETSFDAADFVVTRANRLAMDHIRSYPDWPAPLSLITGPAKSGKSHLAGIWKQIAGALSPGATEIAAVAKAGGNTPVVLDDVERSGFDERDLFHLLNQSIRDFRPLLMTARTPPDTWCFETADVISRVRLAAHFGVFAAGDTQLAQMFVKLFGDRQLVVEPKTITYLVARMERSPEEVVLLVALMDKMALSQGKSVTRRIAAQALAARARIRDGQPDF